MTQDTHNQTINQQNLDRLQVQWVLGKNRGADQPLVKEQLVQLLDAGRLHWSQLSKLEKRELVDDRNLVEKVEEWRSASRVNGNSSRARVIDIITDNMLAVVRVGVAKELSEAWDSMDEKTKNIMTWERFLFEFGVSPDELRKIFYKVLS